MKARGPSRRRSRQCVLKRVSVSLAILLVFTARCLANETSQPVAARANATVHDGFDVVIAGGSTAAFAAALAAASQGARTALIEPTDWVGGQLTSSGVPAVDEAWHTVGNAAKNQPTLNVSEIARDPANITPSFLHALNSIEDRGDCWVSRFCFRPDRFLEQQLRPMQKSAGRNLTVFLNTVVKRVELDEAGSRIVALHAIQRQPKKRLPMAGYDRLPSQDLPDWYSPTDSDRFTKRVITFKQAAWADRHTVFIEATEWGEVLALSKSPYLQGVESADGGTDGKDTCGQAIVYCFTQEFLRVPASQTPPTTAGRNMGFGQYEGRDDAWEKVWTYRRICGNGKPGPGDICLQNWGYSGSLEHGGNDYPFGYLFKSKADTSAELANWQGGIDLDVLAEAEQRAFAWHDWFRQAAPKPINPNQIELDSEPLGTAHGLAKLPYIRDTRRSIGLDGFILKFADLTGPVAQVTGTRFPDRIALGAYPADVHPITTCSMPSYLQNAHDTLPFYIPFRALTNDRISNLLVAGKTMAQSFAANSATRLHPIEWSTGTAAGVAASYMARTGKTSRQAFESIHELQGQISQLTPIDWTIDGEQHTSTRKNGDP